jgi:hypothetical protein
MVLASQVGAYMLDPAAPKVVARQDWFAAPARPERQDAGSR